MLSTEQSLKVKSDAIFISGNLERIKISLSWYTDQESGNVLHRYRNAATQST